MLVRLASQKLALNYFPTGGLWHQYNEEGHQATQFIELAHVLQLEDIGLLE